MTGSKAVPRRIALFCSFGTGGDDAKSSAARSAGVVKRCSPCTAAATDAVIRLPFGPCHLAFNHSWLPCGGLGTVYLCMISPCRSR